MNWSKARNVQIDLTWPGLRLAIYSCWSHDRTQKFHNYKHNQYKGDPVTWDLNTLFRHANIVLGSVGWIHSLEYRAFKGVTSKLCRVITRCVPRLLYCFFCSCTVGKIIFKMNHEKICNDDIVLGPWSFSLRRLHACVFLRVERV